jgi:hypothetical protein
MFKKTSDIVQDVRVCIDEIAVNDAEWLSDQDDKELSTIIKSKIEESLRYVLLTADLSFLEPKVEEMDMVIKENGLKYASINLDDTFLRFVSAYVDGWSHRVTEPILNNEKVYATLKNAITTGYPDNPKVALIIDVGEGKELELYGIPEGETQARIAYIQDVATSKDQDDSEQYYIPTKVYRGLIYYIAGATLAVFGDARSENFMTMALPLIGANIK